MHKRKAQEIVRQTRRIYNTIARDWNISRGQPSGVKIKLIKPLKKGMKVLDLGCGNGLMTQAIIDRGAIYAGLDISSKLISICKKKFAAEIRNKSVKFFVGDALKLPFKNNCFDYAISLAVMHHIPSAELRLKFLRELYRVLKIGATAKIDNWNLLEDWGRKKFNIRGQLAKPPVGHDRGDVYVSWKATGKKDYPRFIHIFSDTELRALAREAGFKKIKIEYFNRAGKKIKNGEAQILTITK